MRAAAPVAVAMSVISLSLFSAPARAVTTTTIALTGDTAPDTGGVFQYFSPPLVNDGGDVVVVGGNAVLGVLGVWIASGGSLNTVVLNGDVNPDTGLTLGPTQSVQIANDGSAGAFHPATSNGDTYDSIWRGPPGSYDLMAIEDDDGEPFGSIRNDYLMFDDGSMSISVTSGTFPFPRALYLLASGGGETLVAQELAAAPGTSTTFESIFPAPVGNEVGGILLMGDLDAPSAADRGLWYGTSTGTTLVAREGDLAPGLGGETFTGFTNHMLADTGEVGFWFSTNAGTWGYMTGMPNSLSVAVKTDDLAPVPGEPDADYLAFQTPGAQMSGSGDFAFVATVAGININSSNSQTIFSVIDDVVSLVAREGDPAPGAGGATFTDLDTPMINDLGQVVFTAQTSAGEEGIWLSGAGGIELIAQTGDLFDVGGGDLREIVDFGLRTEPRIHKGALGDSGHVAFQLYFDDASTGLFRAVPEPSVAAGILFGSALIARLHGRRRFGYGQSAELS